MSSQAFANYANTAAGLRQGLVEAGSQELSIDDDKKQFESSIFNQSTFLAKAKATEGIAGYFKNTNAVRTVMTKLGRKVGKSRDELRAEADQAKIDADEAVNQPSPLEVLETTRTAKLDQLTNTNDAIAANTAEQGDLVADATSKADALSDAEALATTRESEAADAVQSLDSDLGPAGNSLASTAQDTAVAARKAADMASQTSEDAAQAVTDGAARGTELTAQAADHGAQLTEATAAFDTAKTADDALKVGEVAQKASRIEKTVEALKITEATADAADAAVPDPVAVLVTAIAAIGLGLIGRKIKTHDIIAPSAPQAVSYSATPGA